MNRMFQKRPLLKTGVFGLLLLPFVILINSHSPDMCRVPKGYSSTIVAFEFASNITEVGEVMNLLEKDGAELGCEKTENSEERDYRRDVDMINYIDFGMMVIYGIFLFLFMANFGAISGDKLVAKMK